MPDRPPRLAIIGAGSVVATIAYACLIRGVAKQVVLHDVNRAKVDAEVLDGDLCLPVPWIVNRGRVDRVLSVPMSGEDEAG